jgi:hypothetical protein
MLALFVWLLAQPLLAVALGVVCGGARRETRVEETVQPTQEAPPAHNEPLRPAHDEPLTPALAS